VSCSWFLPLHWLGWLQEVLPGLHAEVLLVLKQSSGLLMPTAGRNTSQRDPPAGPPSANTSKHTQRLLLSWWWYFVCSCKCHKSLTHGLNLSQVATATCREPLYVCEWQAAGAADDVLQCVKGRARCS
jgi:hypothetical protein